MPAAALAYRRGKPGAAEASLCGNSPTVIRPRYLRCRERPLGTQAPSVDATRFVRYGRCVDTSTVLELNLDVRSDILKAIADPTRLEILEMLSSRVRCNCHLQERLDLAPNLLSYHLKVLRDAGLIEGTRRGRWIDYALAPGATGRIASALPAGLRP